MPLKIVLQDRHTHTHTHTHIYIYIYIKSSQARQLYNTSTPLDPEEYWAVLNIYYINIQPKSVRVWF